MAIRNLRYEGDPILRKTSKEVKEITPKIVELIDDMLETMYEAGGVGLAAPQVGVLKRIVVIDVGDGPFVLINPQITKTEGSQTGDEGCLSVPGKAGTVTMAIPMIWKEQNCWREPSATSAIIWMESCMWIWWKENFTILSWTRRNKRI